MLENTNSKIKYSEDQIAYFLDRKYNHHGDFLEELINVLELSKSELARLISVDRQLINAWINKGSIPGKVREDALLTAMGVDADARLLSIWEEARDRKERNEDASQAYIAKRISGAKTPAIQAKGEPAAFDAEIIGFAERLEAALYHDANELSLEERCARSAPLASDFVSRKDSMALLRNIEQNVLRGSVRDGLIYDRIIDARFLANLSPSASESIRVLEDATVKEADVLFYASCLRASIYNSPVKENPIFKLSSEALEKIALFSARYSAWYLQGLSLLDYVRTPEKGYDPVCTISENALRKIILIAINKHELMPLRPVVSTLISNTVSYNNIFHKLSGIKKESDSYRRINDFSYARSTSSYIYIPLLKEWCEKDEDEKGKMRIALALSRLGYVDNDILKYVKMTEKYNGSIPNYLHGDALLCIVDKGGRAGLRIAHELLTDNSYFLHEPLIGLLHNYDVSYEMMHLIFDVKREIDFSQGEVSYFSSSAMTQISDVKYLFFLNTWARIYRAYYGVFLYIYYHRKFRRPLATVFSPEKFFILNDEINYFKNGTVRGKHIWNVRFAVLPYFKVINSLERTTRSLRNSYIAMKKIIARRFN